MAKNFTINDAGNTAVRALIYQFSKVKFDDHFLNDDLWETRKTEFGNSCIYCGTKNDIQKEHLIDCNQDQGGLHIIQNVFPACGSCNRAMARANYKEKIDKCKIKTRTSTIQLPAK